MPRRRDATTTSRCSSESAAKAASTDAWRSRALACWLGVADGEAISSGSGASAPLLRALRGQPVADLAMGGREQPSPEAALAAVLEAVGLPENLPRHRLHDVAALLSVAQLPAHAHAHERAQRRQVLGHEVGYSRGGRRHATLT
jgi:hypothetical protein